MEDSSYSSGSSPRMSFSRDTINNNSAQHHHINDPDFEFLSSSATEQSRLDSDMTTADKLFAEGKLLPFWQVHKLNHPQEAEEEGERRIVEEQAAPPANVSSFKEEVNGWFMEEDPSPRPPNCTLLFKELLRLKKQRRSTSNITLSPPSSTSSSSSTLFSDVAADQKKNKKNGNSSMERTKSATIGIRPMVNLPICTPLNTSNNHCFPPPRQQG